MSANLMGLQKGDKVRFIGPAEEFHEDVTVGKIYEINGFWVNGEPTFLDDLNTLESYSIIEHDAHHLFEKVVEVEQVPIIKESRRTSL